MRYHHASERTGQRAAGPLLLCLAFVVHGPGLARADSPKACAESYEKAQEERKAGHITAAIENLTKCAARDCPSFVSKDCIQWLTDAQSAQPSVVFAVRRDGVELTSVEIAVDGRVLTESIDGKAMALDPGAHRFTFRAADGAASEKTFIIREGERNRIIDVELTGGTPVGPAQTEAPGQRDPALELPVARPARSWLPYGLLGVGALGVSGFAAFGLWGHSQKGDLENSCSPYCRPSQVDEVRTKYIVADACLAVGLISLGAATYIFLRDRESPAQTTSTATFWPSIFHRSGAVDVAISF